MLLRLVGGVDIGSNSQQLRLPIGVTRDVPALHDHLGAAARWIDLLADQAQNGLEVVPGSSTYVVRGNWKLRAEQRRRRGDVGQVAGTRGRPQIKACPGPRVKPGASLTRGPG